MGSSAQPETSCPDLPELAKLRSLIDSGFTHDWLLRIEHAGGSHASGRRWQEWGQPAFAITNAATVVTEVAECHARHPTHAIRLQAEKLNPRTRMLYCVFSAPEYATSTVQTVPPQVTGIQAANDWPGMLAARLLSIGNRTWLVATAIGLAMSSWLIIDEVMS
jgi:ribulose bisphosphate carboxylase small subunit